MIPSSMNSITLTTLRLVAIGGAISLSCTLGYTAPAILVGQTADFSSVASQQMKDFNAGAGAYFDAVNASGGIGGRPIKLVSLDDGFAAAKAKENAKTLIEREGVIAIFGTRGTDPSEAALSVAKSYEVPLVAPITGAASVQTDMGAFPVRADYKFELQAVLQHLNYVPSTIAILVQDDNFGVPLKAFIEATLSKKYPESKIVAAVKFQRKQTNMDEPAKQVLASKASAVIALCNPTSCNAFKKAIDAAPKGSPKPTVYQTSIVDMISQFQSLGADSVAGSPFSQVIPDPNRGFTPFMKQYRAAMDKRGQRYNYRNLEGYLSAAVLVEGLRGANPLTAQGLTRSFEANFSRGVSFGPVIVKYDSSAHSGSSFVEMVTINKQGQIVH